MRGYEVIFKFLMISFKTPIESRFSRDPLHHFPYSSSPTLWIPYIFGIYGKVFQAASGHGSFMAHGSFSQNMSAFTGTWPLTHIVNISAFHQRLPLSGSPPFTLQVLQQFPIDSGSTGSD